MMRAMLDRVRLRPLTSADLPVLHRWYQTRELWDHLVGEFRPRPAHEAIAHMRGWLIPSATEARLAIERGDNGALLGLTLLSPIDSEAGEAEFHIFLGEASQRGLGYGGAATAAMLAHAFDQLGLWRVRLRVLRTNEAALRVYAAWGFEPEPATSVSESVVKQGARVAVVAMSVTDAVFRQRLAAQAAGRSAIR
jgi:RimJ/RimL family protein N-acetyltransferase